MEYVIPLDCSSGKGRKCTLYFYYTKQWIFINLGLMESTETWRGMVFAPVPSNPEKLVQKQHSLQVSIGFGTMGVLGSGAQGHPGSELAEGRTHQVLTVARPGARCVTSWSHLRLQDALRRVLAPLFTNRQPVLTVSEPGICSQAWMTLEFMLFLLHHTVTPRRGSWGWHSGVG